MANLFAMKTYQANVEFGNVFTVPEDTTYIIIGMVVTNLDPEHDVDYSIKIKDFSEDTEAFLIKNAIVPKKTNHSPLIGKLVLEAKDELNMIGSALDSVSLTISYMAMS